MDFRTNIPIYVQIATSIKEQIMSGSLRYGDKLPSVREYSLIYEVSALTIQRAISQLDLEGIIQSKKGIGSFVLGDCKDNLESRMIGQQVGEFVEKMKKMGLTDEFIISKVKESLSNG